MCFTLQLASVRVIYFYCSNHLVNWLVYVFAIIKVKCLDVICGHKIIPIGRLLFILMKKSSVRGVTSPFIPIKKLM